MTVRTLATTGLIVAIAAAATVVYLRVRKVEVKVYVINGLDVPVEVRVSGQRVTAMPHKAVSTTVKVHRSLWFVASRADGTEVDRQTFTLRDDDTPVVYNVLGIKELHTSDIIYTGTGFTSDKERRGETIGHVAVVQHPADFYLDLPVSIQKPANGVAAHRFILDAGGTWQTAVKDLVASNRLDDAIKLAEGVRIAEPDDADVTSMLEQLDNLEHPPPPPPLPTPRSPNDWTIYSTLQEARLVQATKDDGSCQVRCELQRGDLVWARGCIASSADHRFVARDCSRAVIVHPTMETPASTVVSVYENPGGPTSKDEAHPASELTSSTARGEWLATPPRLDANQRSIVLDTIDHKRQTILLGP